LWDDEGKVLVEVQRLTGCGFLFHQAARSILLAAKGTPLVKSKQAFRLPAWIPHETMEESQECMKEDLEIASTLLKCPKIDGHMLALESLMQLTQATKCPSFAAHCVLCGEFLPTLLSLIESCKSKSSSEGIEGEQLSVMHRNALTVLANCLTALESSGELISCIEKQDSLVSKQLLLALLDDVSAARERPLDATQAIRCLQPLVKVHRQLLETRGAAEILGEAEEFGKCRHAQLEAECRKLVSMHF
jgi:hypothetical protein